MTGGPLPPSVTVPLDGLSGMCHRYPDRPPILALVGEHCSVTLRTPADPRTAKRAAAELLRVATAYVAAIDEWAQRERVCTCAGCVTSRPAVPS